MAQNTLSLFPNLHVEERDQAGQVVASYIRSDSDGRIDVIVPQSSKRKINALLSAFLPAGYPQSVTEDYLEYQIYDSLQAFSSSIAGLLASRAVLEGVGVGDASASPTAAILFSVLQDSMGRIATILFAHKLGTALEPECKMYRLAADFFNDAAMILDCLSPALPKSSRVLLLSLSSALRALCGVAGSSSKASLSAHFAIQGNLAELNAISCISNLGHMLAATLSSRSDQYQKDSSQETIISLLGMLTGSLVVSRITSHFATWLTLLLLLSIHLWTNYRAVRAVRMRTLNRQRANIVFSSYLQSLHDEVQFPKGPKLSLQKGQRVEHVGIEYKLPSPKEVSLNERIFELDGVLRWHGSAVMGYCALGVPLIDILNTLPLSARHPTTGSYSSINSAAKDANNPAELDRDTGIEAVLEVFKNENYTLSYSVDQYQAIKARRPRFLIVLKENSGVKAQVKGWFHAFLCARKLYTVPELITQPMVCFVEETLREVQIFWPQIEESLEKAGWDLVTGALETRSGVRVTIESKLKD